MKAYWFTILGFLVGVCGVLVYITTGEYYKMLSLLIFGLITILGGVVFDISDRLHEIEKNLKK